MLLAEKSNSRIKIGSVLKPKSGNVKKPTDLVMVNDWENVVYDHLVGPLKILSRKNQYLLDYQKHQYWL